MGLEILLSEFGKDNDIFKLCDLVRETSFAIHKFHRQGHLENVYENALAHRLRKIGLSVEQRYRLPVYDEDGAILGNYKADLFVDNRIIVEVKACRTLVDENIAQLLGNLRSSKIEHGLLH
jgi:GxxExxY protein